MSTMMRYKDILVYPNNAVFRNRARPVKQRAECICICPTCRKKYILRSNSLYTDRINWIYCERDERNRFRDAEGFEESSFGETAKSDDQQLKLPEGADDPTRWQQSKKRLGV